MIWALGILLALAMSLYLGSPFLTRKMSPSVSNEVSTYRDELKAIEQSEDPEAAKNAIIQARLLKAAKASSPLIGAPTKLLPILIGLALIGGSAGIYALIGSPNFMPETRQAAPAAPAAATEFDAAAYQNLLPRFEAHLADNPEDAKAWAFYGRTLMLSGDPKAGLRAYERSLDLNDIPDLRKEYEAAKKFAAQRQSGPSSEDIAAMQSLSPEDRNAAIEGMVENLRARLETDPSDIQGWVRLLRSRKVLGQLKAGAADIETLREVLPEQADQIISQSGWNN